MSAHTGSVPSFYVAPYGCVLLQWEGKLARGVRIQRNLAVVWYIWHVFELACGLPGLPAVRRCGHGKHAWSMYSCTAMIHVEWPVSCTMLTQTHILKIDYDCR